MTGPGPGSDAERVVEIEVEDHTALRDEISEELADELDDSRSDEAPVA